MLRGGNRKEKEKICSPQGCLLSPLSNTKTSNNHMILLLLYSCYRMRNINGSSYVVKQVDFFLVYTFPFDGAAGRVGSDTARQRCDGSAMARRSAARRQWRGAVATAPVTVAPALWLLGVAATVTRPGSAVTAARRRGATAQAPALWLFGPTALQRRHNGAHRRWLR